MVKDIIREIKNKWFQFIAILVITALGVGFFIGIRVTGFDMRKTADVYMEQSEMLDMEYRHTLGIDDEMLKQLSDIVDGEAIGVRDTDAFIGNQTQDGVAKIIAINDQTQKDMAISNGRYPENKDEIFIDKILAERWGIKLGDTLKLKSNDIFETTTLTVVGMGDSSLYLNLERGSSQIGSGNVVGFVYGYDLSTKTDIYTSARFAYPENTDINLQKKKLEDSEEAISSQRRDRLIGPEIEKLNNAQSELDTAKLNTDALFLQKDNELKDAKNQLDASYTLIESGIREIMPQPVDGDLQVKLDSAIERVERITAEGFDQIAKTRLDREKNQAMLNSQKEEINENKEVLEGAIAELDAAIALLPDGSEKDRLIEDRTQVNIRLQEVLVLEKQVDKGLFEVEQRLVSLEENERKIKEASLQAQAGKVKLQEGINQYNSGMSAYLEGLGTIDAAKKTAYKEINDNQVKIDDGRRNIDNVIQGKSYVLGRDDVLVGYKEFYQDSDRIEAIGQVFPLIFFGVAILVTLSTVSRMVDESRMQIGVYKALGYSWFASSMKFVGFAGIAWLIGTSIGVFFGFYSIPTLIYNAYRIMYQMPPLETGIVLSYAWLPILVSFISSVGVAMFKSMSVSREKAANLLRPPVPKSGQRILLERIPLFWDRLTFLYKVSLRNLFRNKTRFLMTIVGIGGCCGLLITGFGLQHSIYSIVDKQFDEIIQYDGMVLYNGTINTEGISFDDTLKVSTESVKIEDLEVNLYVPEEYDKLQDFIALQDRKTHKPVELSDDTVVITEKLAILKGVDIGDSLTFTMNERNYTFKVGGITENYVMHYIYMSPTMYETLSGKTEISNVLLFKTDAVHDSIAVPLLEQDSIYNVSFLSDIRDNYQDMMGNFDIVIYVITGAAFALEVIVLLNLITMNVSERKKELATLKVLGFYPKELAQYILRENILLTIIALLFGVGFGSFLHRFVILQAELDAIMFNRELLPMSVVGAIALTFGLSLIINLMMSKKSNNVNMSEALKTFDA